MIDHPDRIGPVNALGLDETLFTSVGKFRTELRSTQIVDLGRGQLLDVVPGRDSVEPCRWLAARDDTWRAGVEWPTLDLSASYRVPQPDRHAHFVRHCENRRARISCEVARLDHSACHTEHAAQNVDQLAARFQRAFSLAHRATLRQLTWVAVDWRR